MFRHWAFASPPPVIPTGAPDRIRGEVEESRRRRSALVVRAEPRSLHSPESRPGSVGMTDERSGRDGDLRCHEMSCFVMIRCCRAFAVYRPPARTDHSIYHVFLHRRFRPKPHRRPGPSQTVGRRRPPKKRICSYNVPSADVKRFFAASPSGFRPGDSPCERARAAPPPLFSPFSGFAEESASASEVPARSTGDGGVAPDRREAPRRKERGGAARPATRQSHPASPSEEGER